MNRKPLRILLVAVYSVMGALLLLEVALRIADPMGIVYYFASRVYFGAMVPDPDFGYIQTPHFEATLQGVAIEINSEGLRGPECDVNNSSDARRLLILGDSVVFGWGVPQDSIFPARLRMLTEGVPGGFDVVAAGTGSWNTRNQYEWLRKRGRAYNPDIMFLVATHNDVVPNKLGRTEVSRERLDHASRKKEMTLGQRRMRRVVRRSYVLTTVKHFLKRRSTSADLLELLRPESPAWEDAQDALIGIVNLCRETNIELRVFLYGEANTDFTKAFQQAYDSYLSGEGVTVELLSEEIYQRKYRNTLVDPHPNAEGHRLIAEDMFTVLQPLL